MIEKNIEPGIYQIVKGEGLQLEMAISARSDSLAAQELGINPTDIATNSEPWNTKSEAAEYLKRFGTAYKLYLVTDAAHMPRALMEIVFLEYLGMFWARIGGN